MGKEISWTAFFLENQTMDTTQKARYAQAREEMSMGRFWKAKVGDNPVRFLPQPPGSPPDAMIMNKYTVHYQVGPNKGITLCNKPVGQRCAVCEAIESGSPAAPGLRDNTNRTFDFNLLDLGPGFDPQVLEYKAQVWGASSTQAHKVLNYVVDDEWGEDAVVHPELGKAATVTKTDKSGNINYDVRLSLSAYPIDMNRIRYADARTYDTYEAQFEMLGGVASTVTASQPAAPPPMTMVPTTPVPTSPFSSTVPPPAANVAPPGPLPSAPPPVTTAPPPIVVPGKAAISPPMMSETLPLPPPIQKESEAPPAAMPTSEPPSMAPPIVGGQILHTPVPEKFWCAVDGQTLPRPVPEMEIRGMVAQGKTVMVMTEDETSGWKQPSELGIG